MTDGFGITEGGIFLMVTNQWQITNGNWYYLQFDGTMLTSAYTHDGYYVNGNGVWVQNNNNNQNQNQHQSGNTSSSRDLLSFSSNGYVADTDQPYAYRPWLTLNKNGTFVFCQFDGDYQEYNTKGDYTISILPFKVTEAWFTRRLSMGCLNIGLPLQVLCFTSIQESSSGARASKNPVVGVKYKYANTHYQCYQKGKP